MISLNEFNDKVTLGYIAMGNTLQVNLFYKKESKLIELGLNVFVFPGQAFKVSFNDLKKHLQKNIAEWYIELEPILQLELQHQSESLKEDKPIQLEFDFVF